MTHHTFFISASKVKIPSIIYGTAWKKDKTAALVEQALKLGFRGIDTACQPKHYQEAGVGDGMTAFLQQGYSRNELYVQTKFTPINGQDPLQIPYDKKASLVAQVKQSFLKSLQNLQTDYLDGLILHSPLANPVAFAEVWRAMEQRVIEGGVLQLGISNCYDLQQLKWLCKTAQIKPAILQNRFYADTHYDIQLREYCREQQIIYQSFWTLSANPQVLAHPKVQDFANRYQRTPAQIFFRYLTQSNIIPLTGTTSLQHMQEDLAIFDFGLQASECAQLTELFKF
jgi:diketogulonate reductase-like aldo/keto reductase